MSNLFMYNERTGYYGVMDGGHSVYIADDVIMAELQLLQENEGLSEAEALDEVSDVGWWMKHLPMSGVFFDGIEQKE
jgi:hypothetical protein